MSEHSAAPGRVLRQYDVRIPTVVTEHQVMTQRDGIVERALGRAGIDVLVFDELPTTMDEAFAQMQADERPLVVLTARQTAGRGRQRNTWQGMPSAFAGTFAFPSDREPASLIGLSLAVGVWVARALQQFSLPCGLKWPNDLCGVEGRKFGGILIENRPFNNHLIVAIGIGINIQSAPDFLPEVCALSDLGHTPEWVDLADALLDEVTAGWRAFQIDGFAGVRDEWLKHALYIGEQVRVKRDDAWEEGSFEGISEDGALLFRTKKGLQSLSSLASLRPLSRDTEREEWKGKE